MASNDDTPEKNGGDRAPLPPEFDIELVKAKHRDLTDEVVRLADLMRRVSAGDIPRIVFEGELHRVADEHNAEA